MWWYITKIPNQRDKMDNSLWKKSTRMAAAVCAVALVGAIGATVPLAYANQNEAYEGVLTNTGFQIGVGGGITVKDPKVSPTGFTNHRDYMVYINDASVSGTVGAGYYTQDGTNFWSLIYYYPVGGYPTHDLFNTLSRNTNISASVLEQNDNPNSGCWIASSPSASSYETICFSSSVSGASNVGMIARTFSSYTASNDLYGYIYNLQAKYKTGSGTIGWESFQTAGTVPGNYKCWSTKSGTSSGYVLSYQTNENTIGTGPRTYTTDSCTSYVSAVYQPYGENTSPGGN